MGPRYPHVTYLPRHMTCGSLGVHAHAHHHENQWDQNKICGFYFPLGVCVYLPGIKLIIFLASTSFYSDNVFSFLALHPVENSSSALVVFLFFLDFL